MGWGWAQCCRQHHAESLAVGLGHSSAGRVQLALSPACPPAVLARLHELAEAEAQLASRQAAVRECEAALKAMSAAAASFKK